ncbi:hypothetical protein VPH35_140612 [Triticum aestivum]
MLQRITGRRAPLVAGVASQHGEAGGGGARRRCCKGAQEGQRGRRSSSRAVDAALELCLHAVLQWSFAGCPPVLHWSFIVPRGAAMELQWSFAGCRRCCFGALPRSVLPWSSSGGSRCCDGVVTVGSRSCDAALNVVLERSLAMPMLRGRRSECHGGLCIITVCFYRESCCVVRRA